MYSTILTELGIAVFDDKKCLKTFPFENPAEEYVLVKKHESKLSELGKFLANGENVIVNDHGLLDILKKKSIDVQLIFFSKYPVTHDHSQLHFHHLQEIFQAR